MAGANISTWVRRGVPNVFADTAPLRQPQFRRLWFGYVVSQTGSQLAVVTVAYQVFLLTRSSMDVGLVGLAQVGPAIIGPLVGGSLADAFDRKRLLLGIQVMLACCSVGLAINSQESRPALWPLYLLPALSTSLSSADNPMRTAVMMNLAGREKLASASALRQSVQQLALVAGPALGGILLAAYGATPVYWIDAASFATSIGAILTLPGMPPKGGGTRFGLRSVVEGFRFVRDRQAIQGCLIADLNATILGMPTALFPALGLVTFHGGAHAVGFLYAAPGVGALVCTLLSGWTRYIRRLGQAVASAIVVWGTAITAFGLVRWLPVALALLAVAGGADVISAIFRNTVIQLEAPDELRGRLSSIHTAVVQSGPRLGNAEAGAVASLSTPQISVVSGGLGCLAGILLISALMPAFRCYRAETGVTAASRL